MVGWPALRRIEARDGFGAGRIGSQAVHGLRRKGDKPTRAQDLRGAAYFCVHAAMLTQPGSFPFPLELPQGFFVDALARALSAVRPARISRIRSRFERMARVSFQGISSRSCSGIEGARARGVVANIFKKGKDGIAAAHYDFVLLPAKKRKA